MPRDANLLDALHYLVLHCTAGMVEIGPDEIEELRETRVGVDRDGNAITVRILKIARRVMSVEFYRDKNKEWRWRAKSSNGQIIATSSEGYKNYADCVHGLKLLGELFDRPIPKET